MNDSQVQYKDEPFLQQEIILGLTIAIGMLMMIIDSRIGIMVVGIGSFVLTGIYVYRIYSAMCNREGKIRCGFEWVNNGALIFGIMGVMLMLLLTSIHRPVFYSSLGVVGTAMLMNGVFLRLKVRGLDHIIAQIRLMIVMVLLVVFYLL